MMIIYQPVVDLIPLEASIQEVRATIHILEELQVLHRLLPIYTNLMFYLVILLVGGGPPGYDYRNNTMVDLVANGTYSSVCSTYLKVF